MNVKRAVLACAISAALALPTPGMAKPSKKTTDNSGIVFLLVGAIVGGILFTGSASAAAPIASTKNGPTTPFNGVAKGPVVMNF